MDLNGSHPSRVLECMHLKAGNQPDSQFAPAHREVDPAPFQASLCEELTIGSSPHHCMGEGP